MSASSAASEHKPSLAPSGLDFYFSRSPDNKQILKLYRTSRTTTTEAFGPAAEVTEFNGTGTNMSGFILSPDGMEAFYNNYSAARIWRAHRSCGSP